MINFDDYKNEKKKIETEHNPKWPYILDHS